MLLIVELVRCLWLKIMLLLVSGGFSLVSMFIRYMVVLCLSRFMYGLVLWLIGMVLSRKLKLLVCVFICVVLCEISILLVFRCLVLVFFFGVVVIIIMCVLSVLVNFMFMWFRLLRLIMLIFWFGLIF